MKGDEKSPRLFHEEGKKKFKSQKDYLSRFFGGRSLSEKKKKNWKETSFFLSKEKHHFWTEKKSC